MCDPIQEIKNGAEAIWHGAEDIVSGVWHGIKDIGEAAVTTAKAILKNPLPTLVTIGLTYLGVPPELSQALITAAQGGSMEDIALSYAKTFVASQAGEYAGNQYSSDANLSGTDLVIKNVISSSSSSAALVALDGGSFKDVLTAGISSGVGSYINSGLKENGYSGYTTEVVTNASRAATNAILKGKDIKQAIGQSG